MSEDWMDKLMSAWLGNQTLEQITSYAEQGRRFGHLDSAKLTTRWVEEFKSYAANPTGGQPKDMADLEAELRMRGQEPPHDLVKDEMATLAAAAKARLDSLGLTERLKFGEGLVIDLLNFEKDSKTKSSN